MTTAAALDHAAAGSSHAAAQTCTPRRSSARAKGWSSSVSPGCAPYVAKRTNARASFLVIPFGSARLRVPCLHRGLERLVRIRRRFRHGYRMRFNLALEIGNRRIELRILPLERRVRLIVDDNVRVDAMPLDQPLPLRPVDTHLCRRCNAAVDEVVARREPDL